MNLETVFHEKFFPELFHFPHFEGLYSFLFQPSGTSGCQFISRHTEGSDNYHLLLNTNNHDWVPPVKRKEKAQLQPGSSPESVLQNPQLMIFLIREQMTLW